MTRATKRRRCREAIELNAMTGRSMRGPGPGRLLGTDLIRTRWVPSLATGAEPVMINRAAVEHRTSAPGEDTWPLVKNE
jgi:hypothetical protein